MSDLHSIYLKCRRELDYKGRETSADVHAYLKKLLKKSFDSIDFMMIGNGLLDWLINDKKRFRSHGEEWKIEFEDDRLGYFTAHLRRYDREGECHFI